MRDTSENENQVSNNIIYRDGGELKIYTLNHLSYQSHMTTCNVIMFNILLLHMFPYMHLPYS